MWEVLCFFSSSDPPAEHLILREFEDFTHFRCSYGCVFSDRVLRCSWSWLAFITTLILNCDVSTVIATLSCSSVHDKKTLHLVFCSFPTISMCGWPVAACLFGALNIFPLFATIHWIYPVWMTFQSSSHWSWWNGSMSGCLVHSWHTAWHHNCTRWDIMN